MVTWMTFLPAAAAATGAVVALACDAFSARRGAAVAAITGAVGAAVMSLVFRQQAIGEGMLTASSLRGIVGCAVALLAALALWGGWRRMVSSEHGGQTAALGALSLSASLVVITSTDLLTLVIGLETMALAAYGLVALGGTDRAREAAMKYFVQGAAASGLLLVAVGVLLVTGGSTGAVRGVWAASTGEIAGPTPATLMAWSLLLCVMAFKSGAFPFHSWAPDAYETAERPAAALLASVPKVAAMVAAVYLFTPGLTTDMPYPSPLPLGIFAIVATGSIVFGNFAALRQKSFTRMLAYSGIAQVGYAFIGIAAGFGPSVIIFLLVYGVAAAGAFLCAEAIAEGYPDWDGTVAGLAGLSRRRPGIAAVLAVLMLSLTGIPLFAGFVGKLAVFASAAGPWTWLVVIGVLGSVVSFGYYGGVLRAAYLLDDRKSPSVERAKPSPAALASAFAAVVVVVVGVGGLLSAGAWLSLVMSR
jgi:NADH-quinone oxidoreductase subunit N